MSAELNLSEIKKEWHGSLKSYVVGFTSSIILTSISFFLVAFGVISDKTVLTYVIVALAVLQATFQLLFFLHVGQEAKPRWETLVFYFMALILLIIAIGSLWIMNDLDERMMPNMSEEIKHD